MSGPNENLNNNVSITTENVLKLSVCLFLVIGGAIGFGWLGYSFDESASPDEKIADMGLFAMLGSMMGGMLSKIAMLTCSSDCGPPRVGLANSERAGIFNSNSGASYTVEDVESATEEDVESGDMQLTSEVEKMQFST